MFFKKFTDSFCSTKSEIDAWQRCDCGQKKGKHDDRVSMVEQELLPGVRPCMCDIPYTI